MKKPGNKGRSYLESEIRTASPPRLLLMLYEGAIRFCRRGVEAIARKDAEAKHEALVRAQDILIELLAALDRKVAPEIAGRLSSLYVYLHNRLMQANVKSDAAGVEEVVRHLEVLLAAWRQAVQAVNAEGAVPAEKKEGPRVEVSV